MMENKIIDNTFGEMEYKHSWIKKDSFLFLDKAHIVNIIAQAYKGDDIVDAQRENYLNYKKFLEEHQDEYEKKLQDYCNEICDDKMSLDKCLTPTSIIFERDGSWGVLFESDCDIENGVALFIRNNTIEVGPQDSFL